jgi:pre-mRNA-splicing factor SYF1
MPNRLAELSAELKKLRVVDLKQELKKIGLKGSGKKAVLVARLAQARAEKEEAEQEKKDEQQDLQQRENSGEEEDDNDEAEQGKGQEMADNRGKSNQVSSQKQQVRSHVQKQLPKQKQVNNIPQSQLHAHPISEKQHKDDLRKAAQALPSQMVEQEMSSALNSSAQAVFNLEDVVDVTTDMIHEEEISRNKYNLAAWWRYIHAVTERNAPHRVRNGIYERALRCLPGSYKIWHAYLMDCKTQVKGKSKSSSRYIVVNNTFERALVFMHKYPRIWIEYCTFLMKQPNITQTRRVFDRALQALPIMQHVRIWKLYVAFVRLPGIPQETATRVYRRFLQFDPSQREEYVEFLLQDDVNDFAESAAQLAIIVSDDKFVSKKGKTTHRLWMDLCDLITKHPAKTTARVSIEAIIRSGIRRFTDEVGRLWCALADHYIRLANFEKARDVYEEGIETVHTVRDFTMIFDAYTRFEEAMVSAKMEMTANDGSDDEDDDDSDGDDFDEDAGDIDLRIERLEYLMDRRPVLLSSVLLRQNPHNVYEWQNRIKIFKELAKKDPSTIREVIVAYTEAVKTVKPRLATGKPHLLWIDFARYYEDADGGDLTNASTILERASQQPFKFVGDLAQIHTALAEMYIRHKRYKDALEVVQRACAEPSAASIRAQRATGAPLTVQQKLHKSKRLWSLYVDLEENIGTLETTRAAYNRCIELKVITIKMLLNYATLLRTKKYFEDSFTVYEKGINAFAWPAVKDIWLAYLQDFVKRYEGSKLERARELFEQCVEDCPAEHTKIFFYLYAKLEEDYGLVRHSMSVLDRATKAVAEKDQYLLFVHYAKKAEDFFGVTRTRDIYQKAIEILPNEQVKDMCLRFAAMERKLGEIDRARAIFTYASQMCDPKIVITFWNEWHQFEITHGNEDTFKDMLRVKRTVQAQFSQANYMAAEMLTETPHIVSDAEATKLEAEKEARLSGRQRGAISHTNNGTKSAEAAATISAMARSAANVMKRPVDNIDSASTHQKRSASEISDVEGASMGALARFKRGKQNE